MFAVNVYAVVLLTNIRKKWTIATLLPINHKYEERKKKKNENPRVFQKFRSRPSFHLISPKGHARKTSRKFRSEREKHLSELIFRTYVGRILGGISFHKITRIIRLYVKSFCAKCSPVRSFLSSFSTILTLVQNC